MLHHTSQTLGPRSSLNSIGALLTVLLLLVRCAPDDGLSTVCTGRSCTDAGARDAGIDRPLPSDLGGPRDATPQRSLRSIAIRPPSAVLRVSSASAATQDFSVLGTFTDGSESPVGTVVWSLAPNPIATIDNATGRVTAPGTAGGTLLVRAELRSGSATLSAEARVDVHVERNVVSPGAPDSAPGSFSGPTLTDASRATALRYPLDHAVMPNNVAPPDVQWEGGVEGDLYRVRLVRPHVVVNGYVLHSGAMFRHNWPVDPEAWRTLLESDPSEEILVTVDRLDSARMERISGTPVRLRVARGSISGSIYYWDLSEGNIQRIDAITALRSRAVPSPAERPASMGSPNRCIACHTVSRDGRYMSVEMWDGGGPGAAYDLTRSDLSRDPAPTVFGPTPGLNYIFSSFSPDSDYLAINTGNSLGLLRREGGVPVSANGLPSDHAAHPDWSPDGMSLAFITNTNGSWGVDFTRGDLAVVPRLSLERFGAPRTVHVGTSTPGGSVDSHPSFSPDARWLAFQHGSNSRSGREAESYPGRLEIVSVAGGAPAALANANGPDDSSYWPNFSPFNVGGYFWVAFYSRRDYGNSRAGTRGTRRRQLWVTAISNTPSAGLDPSSVPYWLPGQSTAVENISAYWAQVACRTTGAECRVSSECCSGACTRSPDGSYACSPPAAMQCRPRGATCSESSECCMNLECAARVCAAPPG